MPPPTAEWTVMVFLNAKNNLEPFAFVNFDQMSRVGSTDAVNVLVEFGRPQHHYVGYYGGWSQTLRYRVTEGMEPTEANALSALGSVNMGDGAALADFVTWARREYPAKRTMLILWDHGQGWRLRSALTLRAPEEARARLADSRRGAREEAAAATSFVLPEDMRLHGAFRYVSHDEDTGDKLYNREIQDTLEGLNDDGPLDVIGFDACLMGMIETGYAMRRAGTVLVGSEELEPGDGWDYERWLRPLVDSPDADAADLGGLVVDAYRAHYGDNEDATLSAVDLLKVPAAASALSSFAEVATDQLDSQLKVIKAARDNCLLYAPGYGLNSIDLVRLLDQVARGTGVSPELARSASEASKSVTATVDANYAAKSRQDRFGSNGVAVYFPASKLEFQHDPDHQGYEVGNTVYPVEFVQAEKWADFLHAYFERVHD
jgi:hypothetical protein